MPRARREMNHFFPPLPARDRTGWRKGAHAVLTRLGPTWRAAPWRRVVQTVCLGLFVHLFFSDGQYIRDPELRRIAVAAVAAMAAAGIVTLIAQRTR